MGNWTGVSHKAICTRFQRQELTGRLQLSPLLPLAITPLDLEDQVFDRCFHDLLPLHTEGVLRFVDPNRLVAEAPLFEHTFERKQNTFGRADVDGLVDIIPWLGGCTPTCKCRRCCISTIMFSDRL